MTFKFLRSQILLILVLSGLTHAAMPTSLAARDLSSSSPPVPSLIANEREVKDFFDKYIERYCRKDIEGYLWLFSLKALQNQKNALPEIRQAYDDFFKRSQELDYRLDDFRMEIYQNAVEAKARFRIHQILVKGEGEKIYQGRIRWVLVRESGALKILSLEYQHEKSP